MINLLAPTKTRQTMLMASDYLLEAGCDLAAARYADYDFPLRQSPTFDISSLRTCSRSASRLSSYICSWSSSASSRKPKSWTKSRSYSLSISITRSRNGNCYSGSITRSRTMPKHRSYSGSRSRTPFFIRSWSY